MMFTSYFGKKTFWSGIFWIANAGPEQNTGNKCLSYYFLNLLQETDNSFREIKPLFYVVIAFFFSERLYMSQNA